MGKATPRASGRARERVMTEAAARVGGNHRVRKALIRSPRSRSGLPDGFHSRSLRCETSIRQAVRRMASKLKNAS